jgi:TRAP-type C4-dicarboxylate transport system substrate-binding protein
VVEKFKAAKVEVHQMTQSEYKQWLELARKTAWPDYANISPEAKGLLDAVEKLNGK